MAMLPQNGVQGLMTGILGSAAALAIAFPLALGGSIYDPAAATGAARTGFYATNGAGSESVACVVGGQTGPIHLSNGSGVQTQLSGGTQTGASFPVLSLSQTWNNAATAFIAFFANITSTASAAGSQLVNLQVGSVAQFTVSKAGDIGGGSLNVSRTIVAGGNISTTNGNVSVNQTGATNATVLINAATGQSPQVLLEINSVAQAAVSSNATNALFIFDNVNSTTPLKYTAGAIGTGFWTFANTTATTSTTTGALVVNGGIGCGGAINSSGVIVTAARLQSASSLTSYAASGHIDVYRSGGTITPNAGDMVFQSDIAGTNGFYWAAAAATSNIMSLTGAGNLTVNGSVTAGTNTGTQVQVNVNAAAGNIRGFRIFTAGSTRWQIYGNSDAESGSNAGSTFFVAAYDDTGTFIDNPVSIVRASAGAITLGGSSSRPLVLTGALTVNSATLIKSNTTLTNNAASNVGTLTNAPAAGNPTKWIPINDNGTTRNIPAW